MSIDLSQALTSAAPKTSAQRSAEDVINIRFNGFSQLRSAWINGVKKIHGNADPNAVIAELEAQGGKGFSGSLFDESEQTAAFLEARVPGSTAEGVAVHKQYTRRANPGNDANGKPFSDTIIFSAPAPAPKS